MNSTSFILGYIVSMLVQFVIVSVGRFVIKAKEKKQENKKSLQDWKDFEVSSMEERNDAKRK